MRNLLIVGNFASDTGYAWNTINQYFFSLAEMFSKIGNQAFICYPALTNLSDNLRSSGLMAVQFDFSTKNLIGLVCFLRRHRIKFMYLTDRPVFSFKYLVCRIAGVRKIVVHDRTSGERSNSGGIKRLLKTLLNRYPVLSVDVAIAISDFVKSRLNGVSCFPEERIIRIWNGVDITKFMPGKDNFVYEHFRIPRDKKVIFAYSRANKYKGIQVLIEAADILIHEKGREDLFFLYCGNGPDLDYFRSLVKSKHLVDFFLCPGETKSVSRILKGVSIVVVPSLWQEGFGLSVVEGMASGKSVIASRVGGIPEIIKDSENGHLVRAGNSRELALRIMQTADDEIGQEKITSVARKTAVDNFNIEDKKVELQRVFQRLL